MFQATRANKEETKRLLHTINKALSENALPAAQLDDAVELWWPRFQERLEAAVAMTSPVALQRSDRELLEEIISLSRSQAAKLESWNTSGPYPPEVRLAVLCASHVPPPDPSTVPQDSWTRQLGPYMARTLVAHGAPADHVARYRFEWNGITPPPGVSWSCSKGELDYLLSIGRIMIMGSSAVLRLYPGDPGY
jgi:hypothetical protein